MWRDDAHLSANQPFQPVPWHYGWDTLAGCGSISFHGGWECLLLATAPEEIILPVSGT